MKAHRNPVEDKVRSARKRYGDQAALWGLLTALYATGRDAEANAIRGQSWFSPAKETLDKALMLLHLGRAGEVLVGWATHRYHLAERGGDQSVDALQQLLPRAAYPVMEWTQKARPRPNLFDYSVEDAYHEAQRFLGIKAKAPVRQGPVVFRFDDGWTVQDLNTKALLVDEGNHQHICVGQEQHGYPQRVAAGDIKIYSLRDPDGIPHVTLTSTWEFGDQDISEAAASFNHAVTDQRLQERIAQFASANLGISHRELARRGVIPAWTIDFKGQDISGEDWGDANFVVPGHAAINFNGARLSGTYLAARNLRKASFVGAEMRAAILGGADLTLASFKNADMFSASLNRAKCVGANFTNAILRKADLRKADLREATFTGADLWGAMYDSQTVWPFGFDPAAAGARKIE